jgi:hypothetical protein
MNAVGTTGSRIKRPDGFVTGVMPQSDLINVERHENSQKYWYGCF